jgi:hypothetical protein
LKLNYDCKVDVQKYFQSKIEHIRVMVLSVYQEK